MTLQQSYNEVVIERDNLKDIVNDLQAGWKQAIEINDRLLAERDVLKAENDKLRKVLVQIRDSIVRNDADTEEIYLTVYHALVATGGEDTND